MLANLASKIQAKPQNSKPRVNMNPTHNGINKVDDSISVWSKIAAEIAHDDQNRREQVNKKMDRKKIVAEEQRFRRSQPPKNFLQPAGTLTTERLNEMGEVNVVHPWEKSEAISYRQVKVLIARKPHD